MAAGVKVQETEADRILKHFKPGQKKPTPPPASGTRVFYESLYKQRKSSLIALQWCLSYGVLPREECEAAIVELERRKKQKKEDDAQAAQTKRSQAMGNEAASPVVDGVAQPKKEKKHKKHKKKKSRRRRVDDDGADFNEGVGQTNL